MCIFEPSTLLMPLCVVCRFVQLKKKSENTYQNDYYNWINLNSKYHRNVGGGGAIAMRQKTTYTAGLLKMSKLSHITPHFVGHDDYRILPFKACLFFIIKVANYLRTK